MITTILEKLDQMRKHPLFSTVKWIIQPFPNLYLSGGAIRDWYHDDPINDWDIFVGNTILPQPEIRSSFNTFQRRLEAMKYYLHCTSQSRYVPSEENEIGIDSVDTYIHSENKSRIQIIHCSVPFLDHISTFNFTCNTGFYSGYTDRFNFTVYNSVEDLYKKVLRVPDTDYHKKFPSVAPFTTKKGMALLERGYVSSDGLKYAPRTIQPEEEFWL